MARQSLLVAILAGLAGLGGVAAIGGAAGHGAAGHAAAGHAAAGHAAGGHFVPYMAHGAAAAHGAGAAHSACCCAHFVHTPLFGVAIGLGALLCCLTVTTCVCSSCNQPEWAGEASCTQDESFALQVLETLNKEADMYKRAGSAKELANKRELIAASELSETKCQPQQLEKLKSLLSIYRTYTEDYLPYLTHYVGEQSRLCGELFAGNLASRLDSELAQHDSQAASQLRRLVEEATKPSMRGSLHLTIPTSSLAGAVATYMNQVVMRNLASRRDKKTITRPEFDLKFHESIGRLCDRVSTVLKPSLDEFDSKKEFVAPKDQQVADWITSARVCSLLQTQETKDRVLTKAFKSWSKLEPGLRRLDDRQ